MLEINAERVIEASAEEVWAVLTNLDEFRQWNPFIRDARGTPVVGNPVHVRVESSFGLPLRFAATVTEREPNHLLRWRGQVLAGWFARGDHSFTIERLGKRRVRFIQHEAFSGLLPRLGRWLLAREARRGFDAMNEALATRVREARS